MLTVITYGRMLDGVLQADQLRDAEEVSVEVVDLHYADSLDKTILESVEENRTRFYW